MNAKQWYTYLLASGWDRQRAQESVRRWFSADDASAAIKGAQHR